MKDKEGLDGLDIGVHMYGFTHAVGDVVRLKIGGELRRHSNTRQTRYTVIEQTMQICPGGIQRTVLCRGVVPGGAFHLQLVSIHEFELEPAEPFPDENQGMDKRTREIGETTNQAESSS